MTNKRNLLTKEYLQFLGVKEVHENGTVIGAKGKPIAVRDNGHNYKVMGFRRQELGKPFNLYIHHIVWVWFNGKLEPDWDVHHKDKNPANNALDNLVAMPHTEHLRRHKLEQIKESTFELKCKLDRPRSYYEDLLAKYQDEYLKAPELYGKSTDPRYKRVVANIANTKARLRYYDNHTMEVNEMTEYKKDLMELASWKKYFKEEGNKRLWHECCTIEKIVKEKGIEAWPVVKHALEVAHKHFKR